MALPRGTPGWLRPPTLFLLILYATFFPFFLLPVTSTFSFYPSPSISYCLVGRFCLLTLFTGFSPIISYSLEPLFSLFLFHWFPCFSSISVNLLHSDSPHFFPSLSCPSLITHPMCFIFLSLCPLPSSWALVLPFSLSFHFQASPSLFLSLPFFCLILIWPLIFAPSVSSCSLIFSSLAVCLSVSLLPRPLSASGLPRNDFINSLWYPVKELYVNISSILPAWLYMVAFMWKKSNYETKPKKPIINKFPVEMHLLHNEVECLILSCVLSVPSHIITVPTCHLSIKVRLRCGFLILT